MLHPQLPARQQLSFEQETALYIFTSDIHNETTNYAEHRGITSLPFAINFSTMSTAAMKSKISGMCSLISVRLSFQWNVSRFLVCSEGNWRTDGSMFTSEHQVTRETLKIDQFSVNCHRLSSVKEVLETIA